MRHLPPVLILAAVLVACGRPDAPPGPIWRDTARPIASAALFEPSRFEGRWHVVAAYPLEFEAGCAAVTLDVAPGVANDWQFDRACRDGMGNRLLGLTGRGVVTGPGRYEVTFADFPFEARAFWVLWVDFDYRTAVIGTPEGTAGWILNRDPTIPSDRLAAAREMLDFNGYDLSGLQLR